MAGLVQALRGLHRAPRREAELARGLLLESRGRERRRGIAPLRPPLDALDREHAVRGREDRAFDLARIALVRDAEARLLRVRLDLLTAVFGEPCGEARRVLRGVGLDGPVFLAYELRDLRFALADEA